MRPGRLAVQLFSFILIISLATGCSLGTTAPTGTPDPQQAFIDLAIQGSRSSSPQAADQSEQDMLNVLRDQSGARAAFGDQADAIFLQIDQMRAAGLEAMKSRVIGAMRNQPKVASLSPANVLPGRILASPPGSGEYQMRSTVGILMMFGLSTMLPTNVMDNRDQNGNSELPVIEGGDPVGAPGEHFSWQASLSGSRMEAKGNITITLAQPFPYTETAEYTLYIDLCPDADGNVPMQFSFNSSVGLLGGGVQLGANSQVTGHVNDEGKLTSWDDSSTYQGARQPIHGVGENLGTTNNYFEFQMNMTLNSDGSNSNTPPSGDYTRQSSETDENFNRSAMQSLTFMKGFMTLMAMNFAEEKWTSGYCLKITVPELADGKKTVAPSSSSPFTASVQHKFDGADLPLPVIATLSAGQDSVTPSGTKVPAPAAFIYKAPNTEGLSATVNLVTRSKRGIATLDLKFTTGLPTWTGTGTFLRTTAQAGAGAQVSDAYTFQVTFHVLSDGKVEGTGSLTLTEEKESLPGMTCNRPGVSSVIYPPMEVAGAVQLGTVSAPQAAFQLNFKSFPAVLPSSWVCDISGIPYTSDYPATDGGFFLDKIEIAAVDGAQARGENTGGAAYMSLVTTWELQIHKQAAP